MSVEGFFHDAHEVYCRTSRSNPWSWVATFATRILAENYVKSIDVGDPMEYEVRPV